jgi:hypothetical protein
MNGIGAIIQQWRQSTWPWIGGTLDAGAGERPAVSASSSNARRQKTFVADRRGAVAFETLMVYLVLATTLFLPLADMGVAGYQFLSAYAALRAFGEYVQYPLTISGFDPTDSSTWPSGTSIGGYQISNPQVLCGDTSAGVACTSTNVATLPAKYLTYSTTVTLAPMAPMMKSVLCRSSCKYTVSYSERFQ